MTLAPVTMRSPTCTCSTRTWPLSTLHVTPRPKGDMPRTQGAPPGQGATHITPAGGLETAG